MQPTTPGSSAFFCYRKNDSHPLFEVYCVLFTRYNTVICCHSLSFVVSRCTTHLPYYKRSQSLAKIYYYLTQNFFSSVCYTWSYNLFVKISHKNVLFFTSTNPFMTGTVIIKKPAQWFALQPVHWLALQINALVSIW